jgi:2-polyprenyl-6-hydroxyphenyl methylase / 3-demethylubiquinone-9 3-methyltransferase
MSVSNDLDLYERHAEQWWQEDSRFAASLHALNHLRLAEVRDQIGTSFRGVVVDLGCGGGLLAEPLARAGATVIGVDISQASLRAATRHGIGCPGLHYAAADAGRPPFPDACADLVICADVVEHVADWQGVIAAAARIARPGAWFYVNTIDRTWLSRTLAVWLGEGLGFVPRGTHDHRMFVRPQELAKSGERHGWRFERVLGQRIQPLRTLWRGRLSVVPSKRIVATYSAWLRKL